MMNLERAHIRAQNPGGPRFDDAMSEDQRDAWENLIWLCHPHHTYVDRHRPDEFPPGKLAEWKRKREKDTTAGLIGLGRISEDRLQQLLADAVQIRNDRLERAIDRLEYFGEVELAGVVRQLQHNIGVLDDVGSGLPDRMTVAQLSDAALLLSNLDRTTIAQLSEAATGLSKLTPQLVAQLAEAAASMSY